MQFGNQKIGVFLRVALLSLCCLATTTVFAQDKVAFLSEDSMTISVRVTSYAKNKTVAMSNAEKVAVETMLFRGIPGSSIAKNAMIGTNEGEAMKTHKKYLNDLFSNDRYRSFIISNAAVSKFKRDETKKKRIVAEVRINAIALRKDMEEQGVIRRFGF